MINESALAAIVPGRESVPVADTRSAGRIGTSAKWYTLLVAAIVFGWLLRDAKIIDPEQGAGYWLGIVGATMMLFLLIYPLRKKWSILRIFGSVKSWFTMHIVLGLLGPLLILYHCNFSLGSFNSRVALYSMLLVAGSGIIGKYIYARIHRGLYGKKLVLQELQREMTTALESNGGLAALMPNLIAALEVLSLNLQGDELTRSVGVGRSLGWSVKRHIFRFKLRRIAYKDLKAKAAVSPVIAGDFARVRRTANNYIGRYVRLMGRVAQFSFYERLFSLWHILHYPIFLMLILSACVHVLAVHMY